MYHYARHRGTLYIVTQRTNPMMASTIVRKVKKLGVRVSNSQVEAQVEETRTTIVIVLGCIHSPSTKQNSNRGLITSTLTRILKVCAVKSSLNLAGQTFLAVKATKEGVSSNPIIILSISLHAQSSNIHRPRTQCHSQKLACSKQETSPAP